MTKIKMCGLKRNCDIDYVNEILPEYAGFVFAEKSRRFVTPEEAEKLRYRLREDIRSVGVFVDEKPDRIKALLKRNIIDIIQLHGSENETYIRELKAQTNAVIIKAFRIENRKDIMAANASPADYILLDSGGGSGKTFDWSVLKEVTRPYFLAGGLTPENVKNAIEKYHPFAVDTSSSLETDGYKDREKMAAFANAVRQRKD